jgi:hypothetical protein
MVDNDMDAFTHTKAHTAALKRRLKSQVIGWLQRHPTAGPFSVMAALAELASEVGVASDEHQLLIELFRDLAAVVERGEAPAGATGS